MAAAFTIGPLIVWLWFMFALTSWVVVFRHSGLPGARFVLLWLPITIAWAFSWTLLRWLWPAPPRGRDGGTP